MIPIYKSINQSAKGLPEHELYNKLQSINKKFWSAIPILSSRPEVCSHP